MSLPKVSALTALTGLAALTLAPVQAAPIQYVFSLTATGTLNNVAFTDAQITITADGDTTGVYNANASTIVNPVGSPAFTVSGVGAGTLTDDYSIYIDQYPPDKVIGLSNDTFGEIPVEEAQAFGGYFLDTSVGPITSTYAPGLFLSTSAGDLVTSIPSDATFTATLLPAVPETSTTVSFGLLLGLGGVTVLARKRRKA